MKSSLSPTCADVHDVVEGVHSLNDVYNQVWKANVILHDERIDRLGLHDVVHEVEPLSILQTALCQALIGTPIAYSSTLKMRDRRWDGRGAAEADTVIRGHVSDSNSKCKYHRLYAMAFNLDILLYEFNLSISHYMIIQFNAIAKNW